MEEGMPGLMVHLSQGAEVEVLFLLQVKGVVVVVWGVVELGKKLSEGPM